ncbi:MAG: tetratricopeptide repeat protein [bacterium]
MVKKNCMKWVCASVLVMSFLCTPLHSAEDPLKRGMDLYARHRYEEAADMLVTLLSEAKAGDQGRLYLTTGMACLKNAELYRELSRASVSVHLDYLTRLSAQKGEGRSRFVDLFLGETLLEAGTPEKAAACFTRFLACKGVSATYMAIARVGLGAALYEQGKRQDALKLWAAVDKGDPVALSEVAAAYCAAGLVQKDPAAMVERALAMVEASGGVPSMRLLANAIGVYGSMGRILKGIDLLRRADMMQCSFEESPVAHKVIRFYDLALLRVLSQFYGKASVEYLEKALTHPKVQDAARYYLGEAYALTGDIDRSIAMTDVFISSASMSEQYKCMAQVRQAANRYRNGGKADALALLNSLTREHADPFILADILLTCSRLNIESPEAVTRATTLTEQGEGKRLSAVHFALGKYYLERKDHDKALLFMEAGRDKGNKNRIEYNDPLMLVNLAEAYYRTRQFSEALEIYFAMSAHFPAVRQIQVALQGVYSMEERSAGDVKIF